MKIIFQIILALILSFIFMIYMIISRSLIFLWTFNIHSLKPQTFTISNHESITQSCLWSEYDNDRGYRKYYKSYFHCIWNIEDQFTLKTIINKFYN